MKRMTLMIVAIAFGLAPVAATACDLNAAARALDAQAGQAGTQQASVAPKASVKPAPRSAQAKSVKPEKTATAAPARDTRVATAVSPD